MKVFSNFFTQESISIDPRIKLSLFSAVESVSHGSELSLTSIGRGSGGLNNKVEKYCIKRVDRLLGNKTLHAHRKDFYNVICQQFLSSINPIIIVDWSSVYDNNFFILRASVPVDGRAITLYEEIYPESEYTSQKAHKSFLKNLASLLPERCRPIICTDAGFRITWFKLINEYKWFWLGRVRGIMHCKLDGENEFSPIQKHFDSAQFKAVELPSCSLAKTSQLTCRAVLYKKRPKGRKNVNNRGKVTKDNMNKRNSKSAREPWFLVTNLPEDKFDANTLVNIYSRRMSIEETFRDNKNEYYGLGLSRSRTKNIKRLECLLLIAMLAQVSLYIIGKAAEMNGYHKDFQANTEMKRVLSYGYLGLRILSHKGERYQLSQSDLWLALQELIRETYL